MLSTILVAVLAAGGGLAAAVTSTDSSNNAGRPAGGEARTAATATTTTPGPIVRKGAVDWPAPGTFEVAVLNGTPVPGLARGVATRLANAKQKIGTVTNAASQDQAITHVYYATDACIPAAQEIADALDIKPIQRAPRGARVVAGDRASVIVVIGTDQNTAPRKKK